MFSDRAFYRSSCRDFPVPDTPESAAVQVYYPCTKRRQPMLILIVESYIMHPAKKNALVRIFKSPVI